MPRPSKTSTSDGTTPILIVGSSHLALRLQKKLRTRDVAFRHIPSSQFVETASDAGDLEHAQGMLTRGGATIARAICLLEDSDAQNIHLLLAALAVNASATIHVAITNDNLIAHIAASNPNVRAFNPHAIAAAAFADAVRGETHVHTGDALRTEPDHFVGRRTDRIVWKLLALFLGVLVVGTLFFRWSEDASWSTSVYLIATLVSGLNFEDAIVRNYDVPMVVARTIMILSVQFTILIAFSLIVDRIIKRRTEVLEFGRKRYALRNHVIVCGLGRTGFHVTMELLHRGERVVIIESDDENRFLHIVRAAGAHALIGDATLAKNLADADLAHAAGLVSVISDDLRNLEIGLTARSLRNDIRLILRIFDKEIAEEMKTRFRIHFAYSTSSLAAQYLVAELAP